MRGPRSRPRLWGRGVRGGVPRGHGRRVEARCRRCRRRALGRRAPSRSPEAGLGLGFPVRAVTGLGWTEEDRRDATPVLLVVVGLGFAARSGGEVAAVWMTSKGRRRDRLRAGACFYRALGVVHPPPSGACFYRWHRGGGKEVRGRNSASKGLFRRGPSTPPICLPGQRIGGRDRGDPFIQTSVF